MKTLLCIAGPTIQQGSSNAAPGNSLETQSTTAFASAVPRNPSQQNWGAQAAATNTPAGAPSSHHLKDISGNLCCLPAGRPSCPLLSLLVSCVADGTALEDGNKNTVCGQQVTMAGKCLAMGQRCISSKHQFRGESMVVRYFTSRSGVTPTPLYWNCRSHPTFGDLI